MNQTPTPAKIIALPTATAVIVRQERTCGRLPKTVVSLLTVRRTREDLVWKVKRRRELIDQYQRTVADTEAYLANTRAYLVELTKCNIGGGA